MFWASSALGQRLALVGSSGGHLTHLLALRDLWSAEERFWVTFRTRDAEERLAGERVYWCHHPTNRNVPNLVRNLVLAERIIRVERPTVILSSGAAVAVPFAYLGRLHSIPFMFLEVVDRVASATLTGRLVQPVAKAMLVQWPEQQALYRHSRLIGRII